MTEHERIVPEVVLRHKDAKAREFIFEKYYQRYRKSRILSVAWWAVACALGAHRIYLGQYRAAAIIFGVSVISWLMVFVSTLSGAYGAIFILAISTIFIVEGVMLYWNIGAANDTLKQRLSYDIETTPYIPLS